VRDRVRWLTSLAMFSAIAYVVMFVLSFAPWAHFMAAAPYLKYEPKDVIITMAGFVYGPASALLCAVVVAFLEMVTVSSTGLVGFVMNVLAAASFACSAAIAYKIRRRLSGAIVGFGVGTALLIVVMLLWNYLLTPVFTPAVSRDAVLKLLVPVFLPFNLIKGVLNSALTLLLYKPLMRVLRLSRLLPESRGGGGSAAAPASSAGEKGGAPDKSVARAVFVLAALLVVTCAIVMFVMLKG